MKKKTTLAVLAAAAFVLCGATGCIKTQVNAIPGGIVPSNLPVDEGKYTVLNGGKVVTGSCTIDMRAGGPLKESCMKHAIDQALTQCPGADALVGITTDSQQVLKFFEFPPLPFFLENTYTIFVTGTPVKLNQ